MRFPISFTQRRQWSLETLRPGAPWHVAQAIRLHGVVNFAALQGALDVVVARHGVLRTGITGSGRWPEQVVADQARVPLDRLTVPSGSTPETVAAEFSARPFDLARGPLCRAALIETGADRWLFILVLHQIIGDDGSMGILLAELSDVYRTELAGRPPALDRQWMDYGDYAVWQWDRLRGEELARQLEYWRGRLRAAPGRLALPTERPRPAERSFRTALAITTTATRRVHDLALGAGATMFAVLLTGYVVTLARYARQNDLVVGIPTAGRTRAELKPIVGLLTNTLPVRVSLAAYPTFAELLGRVQDATEEALAHDELPFDKLLEELLGDHTLAHLPLVTVRFLHRSRPVPVPDLNGAAAERSRVLFTGTAEFDLTLVVDTSAGDEAEFALEYSTDVFDAPFANRFVRSVTTVLEHAAAAPDTPVADLPLLPAGERVSMTGGRPALPAGLDVRRAVRESPATVTDESGTVPMSAVCERAARLARVLVANGVGPAARVGLCVGRGTGMLTAVLGVWWAGAACVQLDTDFPLARLETIARDAGLLAVVSDAGHAVPARSLAGGLPVLLVDEVAAEPLDPVPVPADALAYTIFVSGSTGGPAGVDVGHRAVGTMLAAMRRDLGLGPGDRFVAATTVSFDLALLELLLPAVCGADLVIASTEQTAEAGRLRSLIERGGATAMQATPRTWRLLGPGVPASLRLRLCAGETLPGDLVDAITRSGAQPWDLSGGPETTWSAGTLGHARTHVLDERLAPVPVGVVGEVYVAGPALARGYHGRPGDTARSFLPDPWGAEPGARMYRTGDLARWRESGDLELVGRTDHRVTIDGVRIECGEVEALLGKHIAVRRAVVISASSGGEPTLVAYVVPRPGGAAARPGADLVKLLRPHLRATLPPDMIPSIIVALPAFPLTPDGQVDRAALPAPAWAPRPAASQEPPRNPVEATMIRIWGELLAGTPIGVRDNLLGLGVNSFTAIRFAARIADTYGVNLPAHHVLSTPTVAELAEIVSADPGFGRTEEAARDAELAELSDDELDDLLRAALAARNRRQATRGERP